MRIQVGDVLAAWSSRAARLGRLQIVWDRESTRDIDRFSRFESEWLIPASSAVSAESRPRLRIDGDRFLFEGTRCPNGEHGYSVEDVASVTSSVGQAFPDRTRRPFERALHNRFSDAAAEHGNPQPFLRRFDGGRLDDFWSAARGASPRAKIHARSEYGSAGWAALSSGDPPAYDAQGLNLLACLMALRPAHAAFQVRPENVVIEPRAADFAGSPCVVACERAAADAEAYRLYWLDPQREFVVRRYIGMTPAGGCQFDINYRHDDACGWVPEKWTVLRFGRPGRPTQQFATSVVQQVARDKRQSAAAPAGEYPVGTWVVDEPAASQYLIREGGARRVVAPEEFRWLPTHTHLLQTESGRVGELIESEIIRLRYWRKARYPALAAGLLLAGAAALALVRRVRRRTTAPHAPGGAVE